MSGWGNSPVTQDALTLLLQGYLWPSVHLDNLALKGSFIFTV